MKVDRAKKVTVEIPVDLLDRVIHELSFPSDRQDYELIDRLRDLARAD